MRYVPLLLLAVLPLSPARIAIGDDSPSDRVGGIQVHVDLGKIAESDIGSRLIETGMKLAAKEMDKDPQEARDAIVESLGFDPLEEDLKVSVSVRDPESPTADLQFVLTLGESTGNLQGLLLAAPLEYETSKHGDHTVHSISDKKQTAYLAFDESRPRRKRVLASTSRETLTGMLDAVDEGEPLAADKATQLGRDEFARVDIGWLPEEMTEEPPLSNISKLLSESSVVFGESGDDMLLKAVAVAQTPEQADQLLQLAQGGVAMVGLFKEEIRRELEDEENADTIMGVLESIRVDRDGSEVSVQIRVDKRVIIEFLREEADLPL